MPELLGATKRTLKRAEERVRYRTSVLRCCSGWPLGVACALIILLNSSKCFLCIRSATQWLTTIVIMIGRLKFRKVSGCMACYQLSAVTFGL